MAEKEAGPSRADPEELFELDTVIGHGFVRSQRQRLPFQQGHAPATTTTFVPDTLFLSPFSLSLSFSPRPPARLPVDVSVSLFPACSAAGRVYKAIEKQTRKTVAIKILPVIEDDEQGYHKLMQEIDMMEKCSCHNIVSFLGSYMKDNDLWVCEKKKKKTDIRSDRLTDRLTD